MISKKIAQHVKELEIHTRRVLNGTHIGGFKSRQRGFGFEFDQLRAYQHGDDVRLIDWKSSARTGNENLFVRQYHEERNRTFMICLDVSSSTFYGSQDVLKQDIMKQISGVLSLAAEYTKDKVGLILFSDRIEKVIPAGKGKQHVHHIIETIFSHTPEGKQTDLNVLCEHVAHKVVKNAIVFLISDFISPNFEKTLKQAVVGKEFIAVSCSDKQEEMLSNVGIIWMQDPETGEQVLVDTRNTIKIDKHLADRVNSYKESFRKYRVDCVTINSQKNFIYDLISFFQRRLMY